MAKRLSVSTANLALKIVRIAFKQAKRDSLISDNPAEKIDNLKQKEKLRERRAFSLPELKRIVKAADDEWKNIIFFGLYTGQRLKDISTLTWHNIHLDREEIRLVTEKTGRRMILPIAKPLLRVIEKLPASDNPEAPLFPRAFETVQRTGMSGHLSNQFYDILTQAGLAKPRSHAKKENGKGRSNKREASQLSFHSLRHTATSLLKNAGISSAIAQEFVGHSSEAISRQYTHIDLETLKKAADSLPEI